MWLLLLLCVCNALQPVRLPIADDGTVKLLVGNPGATLQFHLNFSSSIVELHQPLSRISQTYSDKELFYFADQEVLLPISFNYAPDYEIYDYHAPVHGTLGLGEASPLWRYWYNYTYSLRYIQFGAYDNWAQLSHDERPPVLEFVATECMLPNGRSYSVELQPGSIATYLPAELYREPPVTLMIVAENCQREYRALGIEAQSCERTENFQLSARLERTLNGVTENVTRARSGNVISLGKHFIDEKTLFVDMLHRRQFFTDSVFSVQHSQSNFLCTMILSAVAMAWLVIVCVDNYETRWSLDMTLQLELYAYTVCVVVWLGNVFGMHWQALLGNFVRTYPLPYVVFTGYTVLSSAAAGVFILLQLLWTPERLEYLRRWKHLRVFYFCSAVFTTLWMCVVGMHSATPDFIYIVFSVLALCVSTTICGYVSLVYRKPLTALVLFNLPFYYIFLVGVLIPTFLVIDLQHHIAIEVIWFSSIVLYLALVLFSKYAVKQLSGKKTK